MNSTEQWEKAKEYGVIKANGTNANLHYNNSQYTTINVGDSFVDARWTGDAVTFKLANGKTKRYKNQTNYDWI